MKNTISHDSEKPANGQQVITACAFIHHTFDGVEKVFLPRRAKTKKFLPGVYELPGGHIDYGEDIVKGLKREVNEEFGMDISVGDSFSAFTYTNKIKGSHSIEVIYFATFATSINNIKLNPEDHSEFVWFSPAELNHAITEDKQEEDQEFQVILRGFSLLNNGQLNFG